MYGSLTLYDRIAHYGGVLYGQCPGYGYFGGGPGYFYYGGHFVMLLIIILLIITIYLIIRNAPNAHHKKGGETSESPVDILKRRYASGEITKEQFEAIKRDLSG